jgi:NADPH:quinone reductase-like Zn-dependent oxidoreductase
VLLSKVTRLAPGETVFVPAAAGGVGSYAVQIAELMGAGTIIAAAILTSDGAAALTGQVLCADGGLVLR